MKFGNPSKKSRTIASVKGHVIEFPGKVTMVDGKPPAGYTPPAASVLGDDGVTYCYVPPGVRDEIAAAGMLSESEMPEKDTSDRPAKPTDPEKFRSEMFGAFELLVDAAERDSFSGNGVPKQDAVAKLLGYGVTKDEVRTLWPLYMQSTKDAA